MAQMMTAIRKMESGHGAEIVEIPIPVPGPGEVLIKIKATAICGTDKHIFAWDSWSAARITPPLTFGHECAGEVAEIGEGVKSVKQGDSVSVETHIPCEKCFQCKTGNMHLCRDVIIVGVDIDGTFAEYVRIPEICCWKNNPSLPWEIAAIQEPFGNAVYTVMESDVPGRTVAILGDGPIAAFATAIARASGASRIFCTGKNPYRLEIVRKMGTSDIFDVSSGNPVEWLMDNTDDEGVDVVIDMVGHQSTVDQGLDMVKRAGTYTAFGIPSAPIKIDLAQKVIFKGLRVLGINGRKMFDTWYQVAGLLGGGIVDPSPVITHKMPLNSFHEGMALTIGDEITCGKVVFSLL